MVFFIPPGLALLLSIVVVVIVVRRMRQVARPADLLPRRVAAGSAAFLFAAPFVAQAVSMVVIRFAPAGGLTETWIATRATFLTPALAAAAVLTVLLTMTVIRGRRLAGPAALQPRRPADHLPRGLVLAVGVALGLAVVAILLAGLASSPDEDGEFRWWTVTAGSSSSSASFPGWYYGVPALLILALDVVLAGAVLVLSARAGEDATHRSAPSPGLRRIREFGAAATLGFAAAATLAGTLGRAGDPLAFSTMEITTTDFGSIVLDDFQPLGWALLLAGAVASAASMGFLAALAALALSPRDGRR